MGDASSRELIKRHLVTDVSSYCVSWNTSVNLAWRGLLVACRDLHSAFFSVKHFGFSDTEEVKYRNARLLHYINRYILLKQTAVGFSSVFPSFIFKFGIHVVMFLLNKLGRNRFLLTMFPGDIVNPATDLVSSKSFACCTILY